jgi:TolB protein
MKLLQQIAFGWLLLFAFTSCMRPEQQYKIAYNVYYDTLKDDYEVFIMNMDGSDKKNISNAPGVDWVYYAYKDKIYFISDRDTTHRMYFLYSMDAEGNNVKKVTDLRLEDSWHNTRNDGKEMIVSGRIGMEIRQQLFLINTETGEYQPYAQDTAASFSDPAFSPDGKQIVLRHRQDKRNYKNEKSELWMLNTDDKTKKQLTHFPESDTTDEWFVYHAGPPKWHPKENFISYQSYRDGKYRLFAIKPEGGEPWRLIENTTDLEEDWHSWSSDGTWLTFGMADYSIDLVDIYLMNWESKEIKQLTDSWHYEQAPVFVEVNK